MICPNCRRVMPIGFCPKCYDIHPTVCPKHDVNHVTFPDGLHACPECIKEDLSGLGSSSYREAISIALPPERVPYFRSICDYLVAENIEHRLRLGIVIASQKHQIPVVDALARVCNGDLDFAFEFTGS